MKKFADNNFEINENGERISERVEKRCGKRRSCTLRPISLFSTVFSKDLYCIRKYKGPLKKRLDAENLLVIKSFGSCQPARTAQADTYRYFLQMH